MHAMTSPAGEVPRRLGLKLDPDDLRIISALYFGGVQPAGKLRLSLGLSRLTFQLRVRRLKCGGVVAGGRDPVDIDRHNINLAMSARKALFELEAEIRNSGLFDGPLVGDGTRSPIERLQHWN